MTINFENVLRDSKLLSTGNMKIVAFKINKCESFHIVQTGKLFKINIQRTH